MNDKQPIDFFMPAKDKARLVDNAVEEQPDPDWMHSLPGYQDEVAIHEELAKKYAKKEEAQ